MSSYDDILRMTQEAHRNLAPLIDFERFCGSGLQRAIQEYLEIERLLQATPAAIDKSYMSAIESFRSAVIGFRDFNHCSPAMSLLSDAYGILSSYIARHAEFNSISRASAALGPHWAESINMYKKCSQQASAAELALKAHYASVAEITLLAQERLLDIPWESLGSATTMNNREFSVITRHFAALADRYSALIRSLNRREHFIAAFPPVVSSGPSIEILTSARVLDVLSRPFTDEDHKEVDQQIECDLDDEIEASLDSLLLSLNPELRNMWIGAKDALRSTNPDRHRHVLFSLRELITHVLHAIAPDDEIKKWTADPSHFHEGDPTRAARIRFVCRGINHGPFTNFISADVRNSIEFIDLFHRGHELSVSFSEDQMRTLVTRTESFLRSLLLSSQTSQIESGD